MKGKVDVLKDYTKDHITIQGTNEIEFISQGKVEELSQGSHLTDLVFTERIKAVGNEYDNKEKELENKFKIIVDSIAIIKELDGLRNELFLETASLENDKKIIASIENENYKKLSTEINDVTNKITSLTNAKGNYSCHTKRHCSLLQKYQTTTNQDEYSIR